MARDFIFSVNNNSEMPSKPSLGYYRVILNSKGEFKLLDYDGNLKDPKSNHFSPSPSVVDFKNASNSSILITNKSEKITMNGYFLDFINSIEITGKSTKNKLPVSILEKKFGKLVFEFSTEETAQEYEIKLIYKIGEEIVNIESLSRKVLIPGDGETDWVRVSSRINTSLGKMETTIPNISSWVEGASFGNIPVNKDFELEWNVDAIAGQSKGYMMIGVDNSDPSKSYNTMDYALYTAENFNLYIYENGSRKITLGSYNFSDNFKITRVGDTIRYFQNDNLLYTSLTKSNSPLVFDSSIYRNLLAKNIKITHDL